MLVKPPFCRELPPVSVVDKSKHRPRKGDRMITQLSVGRELFGRLRVLISSAVAIHLLFSTLLVHAQTRSSLKGESIRVLLVPNRDRLLHATSR